MGEGGGGGGGGVRVCMYVCIYVQSRSLITKSDITNSGYNEAQKLVPAKILLYMNRNASVIANFPDITKYRI